MYCVHTGFEFSFTRVLYGKYVHQWLSRGVVKTFFFQRLKPMPCVNDCLLDDSIFFFFHKPCACHTLSSLFVKHPENIIYVHMDTFRITIRNSFLDE